MKIEIVALSLLLSLSGVVYGANKVPTGDVITIQQDIKNTKTIDELVVKMNQAQQQNRYRYMNEIKDRISTQKGKNREEKMQKVLAKMNKERERKQEHMNQESSQHNSNGMNNSFSGGAGGGMSGNSSGGMGGNSGGGMSGNSGNGMSGAGGGMSGGGRF